LRKIADELDGDRAKRHAARMARTRQWAWVTQTVSMLASSGASFVQQEFFKLAETEINYPPMQKPASFNLEAVKEKIDEMMKSREGQ
jgi:hypothetical protein